MSIRKYISVSLVCASLGAASGSVNAEMMYWREAQADDSGCIIKRSNLDGTDIEQLVTIPTALNNPYGLALDLDNGKMYWAERENGKIRRANLDASSPEDILTGLNMPLNIALDIPDGRVYWTQDVTSPFTPEPGAYRANVNGTGIEQLLSGNYLGIDLDLTNRKMYLTQTAINGGPLRADLDGGNLEVLIDPLTMNNVFGHTFLTAVALDLDAGKMYLAVHTAGTGSSAIGRADLDGSNPETIIVDVFGVPDQPIGFPLGIMLDTENAQVYWSDALGRRISRAKTDGTGITVVQDTSPDAPSSFALDLTPGPEIPTLSEWGLATMTLLMLVAGTIVLARRRTARCYD